MSPPTVKTHITINGQSFYAKVTPPRSSPHRVDLAGSPEPAFFTRALVLWTDQNTAAGDLHFEHEQAQCADQHDHSAGEQ